MNAILETRDMSHTYTERSGGKGIRNISLCLERGEVLCLIGPSGGGKSTLLRCLAGLEPIESGEILFEGRIREHDHWKEYVTFVAQDYNLWPHMTVLENIILAPTRVKKIPRNKAIHKATELLKKFGLDDKANVYPSFLSGGQKQRVSIIRAIAMEPKVLLLDEITSALDPELIASVLHSIQLLAQEGQSMIIATHHLRFATEVADRIMFLEQGSIIETGDPMSLLQNTSNKRVADFLHTLPR